MSNVIHHPALFFDAARQIASVGIVDEKRTAWLVTGGSSPRSQRNASALYKEAAVYPAPLAFPNLADRWDSPLLKDFLAGGEPPGFGELLTRVRDVLREHVEFTRPEYASLVACWIVDTYLYVLFPAFARLNINGEYQSGKSKLLQLIAEMAFNGLLRVTPTPAVLFRLIEPLRPTFCLDEMEGLVSGDRHAVLSIINSGYKAGGAVDRTEGEGDHRRVVTYQVYAPMALGGIRGLNQVTESRCIALPMQRGRDPQRINRSVDPTASAFRGVRDGCYRLALTRFAEVRKAWETLAAPIWLVGRQRELFSPLLSLATLAAQEGDDGFLRDVLGVAQGEMDAGDGLPEEGRALFYALEVRLTYVNSVTLYPKTLILHVREALQSAGERDVTAERVGRLLKRYGFRPGTRTNQGQSYMITRAQFLEQAPRYGYPVPAFPDPKEEHWDRSREVAPGVAEPPTRFGGVS